MLEAKYGIAEDDPKQRGNPLCLEVRIQRVHVEQSILMNGDPNRIDPDLWRPLIVSFQKFYGLESQQVHESTLAQIPEALYRSPNVARSYVTDAISRG